MEVTIGADVFTVSSNGLGWSSGLQTKSMMAFWGASDLLGTSSGAGSALE